MTVSFSVVTWPYGGACAGGRHGLLLGSVARSPPLVLLPVTRSSCIIVRPERKSRSIDSVLSKCSQSGSVAREPIRRRRWLYATCGPATGVRRRAASSANFSPSAGANSSSTSRVWPPDGARDKWTWPGREQAPFGACARRVASRAAIRRPTVPHSSALARCSWQARGWLQSMQVGCRWMVSSG